MIETFDTITLWVAGTDTANITQQTTTFFQGTASLEFDKTGVSGTTATITKYLGVPLDIQHWRSIPGAYNLVWYLQHADWTNFSKVTVRLIYEFNAAGTAPTIYDDFDNSATLTGSSFLTNSVALTSPTSSTGSPDKEDRHKLVGISVIVTMDAAANTFSDMRIDGLHLAPTNANRIPSLIEFDDYRLLLPPFDRWLRNPDIDTVQNVAQTARETVQNKAVERIQAIISQLATVDPEATQTLREGVNRAHMYMARQNGFGIARDARELYDTTLDAQSGAGETDPRKINLTNTVELERLGVGSRVRVGPSSIAKREVEFGVVQAITAGSHAILKGPLAYTYASGDPVRSAEYYPNVGLARRNVPRRELRDSYLLDITVEEAQ